MPTRAPSIVALTMTASIIDMSAPMLLWIGGGCEVRCHQFISECSHSIIDGVVIIVVVIKGGECHAIIGLYNPYVVLFILLIFSQYVEGIHPHVWVSIHPLCEVVFVVFQESSILSVIHVHKESQGKVPLTGFSAYLEQLILISGEWINAVMFKNFVHGAWILSK